MSAASFAGLGSACTLRYWLLPITSAILLSPGALLSAGPVLSAALLSAALLSRGLLSSAVAGLTIWSAASTHARIATWSALAIGAAKKAQKLLRTTSFMEMPHPERSSTFGN